jgi:hypothetical protein
VAPEPELTTSPTIPLEEPISLAAADFDDFRALGMSVTQAKRVLRYRDERGLSDPSELDQVPGFPKGYLSDIKAQLLP